MKVQIPSSLKVKIDIKKTTKKDDLLDKRDISHVNTYTQDQLYEHYISLLGKYSYKDKVLILGKTSSVNKFRHKVKNLSKDLPSLKFVKLDKFTKASLSKTLTNKIAKETSAILITEDDPEYLRTLILWLDSSRTMKNIPMLFKESSNVFHEVSRKYERYPADIGFVDENLDYKQLNQIYAKSLEIFEQKCMVRDTWDMFQALHSIKDVSGDIIETGSYYGHSGWLLYKINDYLSKKKRKLYLCDTFQEFPRELSGLDSIWKGTHKVDYKKVEPIFSKIPSVTLVKGDIRDTLPEMPRRKYCFIYIDLDSNAATSFALKTLYPQLGKGGIVFCQDYGKPHLLGARLAIDYFFEKKKVVYGFMSFFSGCKIFVKP